MRKLVVRISPSVSPAAIQLSATSIVARRTVVQPEPPSGREVGTKYPEGERCASSLFASSSALAMKPLMNCFVNQSAHGGKLPVNIQVVKAQNLKPHGFKSGSSGGVVFQSFFVVMAAAV